MMNSKKIKATKITKKEVDGYLAIDEENKASVETVQQALRFFERRRVELKRKKKEWWAKVYSKHELDPKKDHRLNITTGIIIPVEPQKPTVPVKKETVNDL